MNADGSAETQITITPSGTSFTRYYNPSLSPDGTQIAFHRGHYNGNGLQYDIWVMDADGTNQTRVTNDMAIDEQPDWSPDGTQLAFRKEADIYTIEPDGTGLTQVTSTGDDSQPRWSSDGTQFAITSYRDNNNDIWLIDIDGSNPQQLTTNGASDRMPSW
jgi:Tol biopolymer transport system component